MKTAIILSILAVVMLSSGCLTNPFKPVVKGQNLEIAEKAIQGSIKGIEARTHTEAIGAEADDIAENAAAIEDETDEPIPCIAGISDDAVEILAAVDRLKDRLRAVERLNGETAELLKRITHKAQGKRYLSPFTKFMIYLVLFIILMVALKRTAFFPVWSRALSGLFHMFMDGASGAYDAGKTLAATVADASSEIDNDSLPPEHQAQIKAVQIKKLQAEEKDLKAQAKANGS